MRDTQTIPLRNIWLLFLYAADLVHVRDQFNAEVENAADLPELLARLLIRVTEQRIRRNLSRGYHIRSAELSRVRGRIDILNTATGQLLERGKVACKFEEHTFDTPRNRLVRAALERLASRIEDKHLSHRCRILGADFSRMGVANFRPSRTVLASDTIGRNEVSDKLMVSLAEMVFDVVIPSETSGGATIQKPEVRVYLIRRLFEKAIGNALRIELGPLGWQVRQGRKLKWPIDHSSPGVDEILPGMETDIELVDTFSKRKIIIDTKFTDIFTKSQYRDRLLKSGYLFQLYAYLRTQETTGDIVYAVSEGMLLHPQVGEAIEESIVVQGHRMTFKTIDLTSEPNNFEHSIRNIVR